MKQIEFFNKNKTFSSERFLLLSSSLWPAVPLLKRKRRLRNEDFLVWAMVATDMEDMEDMVVMD